MKPLFTTVAMVVALLVLMKVFATIAFIFHHLILISLVLGLIWCYFYWGKR